MGTFYKRLNRFPKDDVEAKVVCDNTLLRHVVKNKVLEIIMTMVVGL